MRITQEADILEPEVRKKVIEDILGPENLTRKRELLKSYEVYKDLSKKYVEGALHRELEGNTVQEMIGRMSNISLLRKIINKKARVYKNGALRTVEQEERKEGDLDKETKEDLVQKQIDRIYDLLNANRQFKKSNRYLELQKNTAIQIKPIIREDGKWDIKMRSVAGHLYDVIEDPSDPEKAMVYIFSFFTQRNQTHDLRVVENRGAGAQVRDFRSGDRRQQSIADAPADEGLSKEGLEDQEFIWWSKNFHFTTNGKGEVDMDRSPKDFLNPIQMHSILSLNKDQDGSYWAVGGEDLVDGSILINVLLTDMYFIAKIQGMGQFFLFAKDANNKYKVGPNQAIIVNMEEGDPTPQIGFANSNPPLGDHMKMIEQYIALLLSTNDLASNTVQGELTANNAASGIQELIVRSEVTSAIEDEQEIFLDAEPELFNIIRAWQNFYFEKQLLSPEFEEVGSIDESAKIKVKFLPFQEFMTEEQKLNIIKQRKDLGIDSMIDLLMRDNPDLSKIEAEMKLKTIMEEKLQNASMFMVEGAQDEQENPDKEDEEEDKDVGKSE